eukprot:5171338-Prymnesium_polylepis.2
MSRMAICGKLCSSRAPPDAHTTYAIGRSRPPTSGLAHPRCAQHVLGESSRALAETGRRPEHGAIAVLRYADQRNEDGVNPMRRICRRFLKVPVSCVDVETLHPGTRAADHSAASEHLQSSECAPLCLTDNGCRRVYGGSKQRSPSRVCLGWNG